MFSDEEVIAAAKVAHADQFIHLLPQGYTTPLSERSSNLSQGQRQLLSIARPILANPAILILDEATSSVDTRTEKHIQEAMRRLMTGRTSFVIANSLSTIRDADQILVIDGGRVIEHGKHEELLSRQGFYHHLYTSQFRASARTVVDEAEAPDIASTARPTALPVPTGLQRQTWPDHQHGDRSIDGGACSSGELYYFVDVCSDPTGCTPCIALFYAHVADSLT